MTSIQKAHVYTTTDGAGFTTFKDAKKAQDVLDRRARLIAAGFHPQFAYDVATSGPEILAALTLPSGRKSSARKAA